MHRAMWCSVTPRKNALAHNHKNQSMSPHVHVASGSGWFPISLLLALLLTEFLYLRGWLRLRSASVKLIPAWRVISFSLGLFLIWMAVGSPLAALDEQMVTVHMIQHLLLMTFAAPLMLLGLPVTPFLQGLPHQFAEAVVGPLFRWPPVQRLGRMLVRPTFSWLAATATLVGWHIPASFTLALQSVARRSALAKCPSGAAMVDSLISLSGHVALRHSFGISCLLRACGLSGVPFGLAAVWPFCSRGSAVCRCIDVDLHHHRISRSGGYSLYAAARAAGLPSRLSAIGISPHRDSAK